jgi:ribonuclease P protein component
VERNRLRRRLRAICAEAGAPLMPGSYLVSVAPGASQLTFRELRGYVYQALVAMAATERAGER